MPICVGVGNNRQIQWINLADYPHWLIGGFTFSGKSNMVNVGLCTLITRQSPQDLRLILIDLKGGLEFNYYDKLPHLLGGIVESVEGIAGRLAQVEAIMYQRFKEIKGIAKRIEEYQIKRPHAKMPRILIVFDEVASMTNHGALTQRINASLREITRMGRAVGIHIWFCTQRPDVSAIDGSIKANLALRLSGRMTTSADSVTVLGNSMAKDIAPIKGRMALQLGPDPMQVQTPHIDEDNLLEAVETAKKYPYPTDDDLPLPDENASIHQVWTPDRVVELSLKHLGGNITAKRVYEAAKDDGLTQSQARALVESVWKMKTVTFDGKRYDVRPGRSNTKMLVEVENTESIPVSIPEPTT
jgi:S-DNA-T family DNA segregation ATPase FtsK/SpoIIIE